MTDEQRKRIHDIEYSCDSRAELAERIVALEDLAKGACTVLRNHYNKEWFDGTVFAERMRELGIEVDG